MGLIGTAFSVFSVHIASNQDGSVEDLPFTHMANGITSRGNRFIQLSRAPKLVQKLISSVDK